MKRAKFLIVALLFCSLIATSSTQNVSANGSWQGEYWNLTEEEHVSDLMPDRTADFTRQDAEIDFEWQDQSPDNSINADYFAARWTKTMYFEARSYDFETSWDDQMRITVDGEVLLDAWDYNGGSNDTYTATTAGNKEVVVEFKEIDGWAKAYLEITPLTTPPEATQLIGQEDFVSSMVNTITPTNYGFGSPEGMAVDTVNHRLFVSDDSYLVNRVLVFNLNGSNELVDKTADYVIGLSSMTVRDSNDCDIANATTLCEPAGLTVDETNNRLFVADKDNHRVLVYDLDNLANSMSASYVLGQNNFEETWCNMDDTVDDNVLCYPNDVDYDSVEDRLFVTDEENNRVMAFDVAPNEIENGMSATGVLGQSNFSSGCGNRCGSISANSLEYPNGVHFDEGSGRLLVADESNSRVLIYDLYDGLTNGEDAQTVLGQTDFTQGNNSSGQDKLSYPSGVHYDPDMDMIFIADDGNNRVVVFDDNGDGLGDIADGANFSNVLGQSDFVGSDSNRDGDIAANTLDSPNAVLTVPGTNRLFVTDGANDRVVLYDVSSITNGEDAVDVMGQADFTTDLTFGIGIISPRGLSTPTDVLVDSENNRVFVADERNARVLIYNTDGDGNLLDLNADNVLGQPDLYSGYNHDWDDCPSASQNNMCAPGGLAYDAQNNRLFVSDKVYDRVTAYDVTPGNIENGADALSVLGQANFTGSASNRGDDAARNSLYTPAGLTYDTGSRLLYVADVENSRVVAYNAGVDDIENGMNADRVIGQADYTGGDCNRNDDAGSDTLCYPRGVAVTEDGQELYIVDRTNNRVVVHDVGNSFENGQTATGVIGQANLTERNCHRSGGPAADGLCYPSGIALDEVNDYLYISDRDSNRVVRYATASDFDGSQSSDLIYGQMLPTRNDCNLQEYQPSKYSLCKPEGVAVNPENGQLWVVDSDNNRVLGYGDVSGQTDTDNDAVSDEVENAGPNNGDANNDGTPDATQPHVASLLNPQTNQYSVLVVDPSCTITALAIQTETALSQQGDTTYNYPTGLMDFTADCGTPGYTTTVTQYHYGQTGTFTVRKHTPTAGFFTILSATTSTQTIDNQPVTIATYQVKDGSNLDIDNDANGTIQDPAGIATQAVGAPNTGLGGGVGGNRAYSPVLQNSL